MKKFYFAIMVFIVVYIAIGLYFYGYGNIAGVLLWPLGMARSFGF